ncbi:MAG: hypothetical protein BWY76_01758 [bacterium ADurb.Bin429]|nr:MAG: hypothetical protein BWY76_01758 [bacterium ADurb.Bin429]
MTWSDEHERQVEGQVELPAIFAGPEPRAPVSPSLRKAATVLSVTGIIYTIFPNGMLLGFALWQSFDGFKLFLVIFALLPAILLRIDASDILHHVASARKRAPFTLLWVSLLEIIVLWLGVRVFNSFLAQTTFSLTEGFASSADRIPTYIPLGVFAAVAGTLVAIVYNLVTEADEAPVATPALPEVAPTDFPTER